MHPDVQHRYSAFVMSLQTTMTFQPLRGIRILSLALNLPGPAALSRCAALGATCEKLEPPAPEQLESADPMRSYSPQAYADMHQGVQVWQAHLKTEPGQEKLHTLLGTADVLLTSFRPSALHKLGLHWDALQQRHPRLCMVRIVGALGDRADEPGHDLTYQAEAGLLNGQHMPASLFADMAGALMASEAVLQALWAREQTGQAQQVDVGLAEAAHWLAKPWHWGLTQPQGDIGGSHAGYQIYACADGRVAVAALEPHFAQRLCVHSGLMPSQTPLPDMRSATIHQGLRAYFAPRRCADISAWALAHDIPIYAMPDT